MVQNVRVVVRRVAGGSLAEVREKTILSSCVVSEGAARVEVRENVFVFF